MVRVGLVSPCGWGNLGDAAILESLIERLRVISPAVQTVAFTLNPDDTRERHGIPAEAICGYTTSGYVVARPRQAAPTVPREASGGSDDDSTESESRGVMPLIRRFLKSFALCRVAYRGLRVTGEAVRCVRGELAHLRACWSRVRELDLVIVAGGGQIDDFWGGAWGHPYVLFRWALLARASRTRFVFLSVGTGTLTSELSRLFVRKSLELAEYRSFRDQGSKDLVSFAAVTSEDPVVPDLAFGYRHGVEPTSKPLGAVGISPMVYKDPSVWPERDRDESVLYLTKLARFVESLVRRGLSVSLFPSVRADSRAIETVCSLLSPDTEASVALPPVRSVEELMSVLDTVDITVASRLHGVLLSYVAGRPVIALSYERKVDALMKDLDCSAFCLDIRSFEVRDLEETLDALSARFEEVARASVGAVQRCRSRIEEQYRDVFAAESVHVREGLGVW